ncbi:MAG: AbrB/MazE/SpoVT family DNA-binding domain-containing protein [Actinomycetota bacterium]|nr:AbrB/MazE/SpoVT family DNA-binding domain-containing protein [Actinomycetota bacterium]
MARGRADTRNDAVRTGIVRHIDELGRIVIPSEIRRRFGLVEKDPVEISVRGDSIVLSRPRSACVFCGGEDGREEHRGRAVCRRCIRELAAAV